MALSVHTAAFRWIGAAVLAAGSSIAAGLAAAPAPAPAPAAPAPAPAAQVSVLELGTTGPAFQTAGENFSQLLTLTYDPAKGTGPLTVESVPLSCDGHPVPTFLVRGDKVEPGTQPVGNRILKIEKPASPEWVVLTAVLTRITTCTGQLRFTMGAQATQVTTIRVTRAAAAEAPVEVSGVQRVVEGVGNDTVTFSMKGLPEHELKVTPALFELGRKGDASGSVLNSALSGWSVVPKVVVLPAGRPADFTLQLDNLSPGEYTGKLDLASDGYKAKSHSFSVSVRYGAWLCAVMVAIGAFGALWLKRQATRVRPKLVVRVTTTKLLDQLDAVLQSYVLDTVEAGVLDAIRSRIMAFDDEANKPGDPAADWAAKAQADLTAEGVKLTEFPVWLNARRRLASITNLDAATLTGLETRLKDARDALAGGTALDSLTVTNLAGLAGDIESAQSEAAREAAKAAADEAAKSEAAATNPAAAGAFHESQAHAEQAVTLLAAKSYAGYRAAYDASGRAYFAGMAQELQSRLPPAPAAGSNSLDLTAVHFAPIAPEVRAHLEQVCRAPDLQAARDSYAKALAALRPVQAAAVQRNLPGTPAIPESKFPDEAVRAQQPLMPRMTTTVREDVRSLTSQIVSLDTIVDVVAVGAAAALGVLLVWMPDPGWGQGTDLIAALLWGMGLHTVGSQTFMGILNLRTRIF